MDQVQLQRWKVWKSTYWQPEFGPYDSPPARKNSQRCIHSRPRRMSHQGWSAGSDQSGESHWWRWCDAGPEVIESRCASIVWWSGGCHPPDSGASGVAPGQRWHHWAPEWRRALRHIEHLRNKHMCLLLSSALNICEMVRGCQTLTWHHLGMSLVSSCLNCSKPTLIH